MQKIILRSFYLILEKKLRLTEAIYPFFHEAENFFDIFPCYVRTSMALIPSQYIKMCWKLKSDFCAKNVFLRLASCTKTELLKYFILGLGILFTRTT